MAEGPNEDPDKKKPWKEAVTELQQFYYEVFGDRDWDRYYESEMEYLERNVGHAVFGPPKELPNEKNGETGYSDEQLQQIRKLCATIKKHGKCSPKCHDSGVLVSIIYVCLNMDEQLFPVSIFRIPNCDPEDELKVCPDQFVDSNCRVYKDWDDFLNNNQLPKCTYCYPSGGVYDGDDNDKVCLEFGKTPAAKPGSIFWSALDTASTVVMVGGVGVGVAALVTTVAAPVMVASTVGAVATGAYGTVRNVAALVDRGQHQQSVNVTNAEARNCWLSLAGNVLGVSSAQAVGFLTKAAQNGQVVGKAGRMFVNILNFGSLAVNGIGLINNFASLIEKYRSEELTTLEVFQFASSCLFFTMSAFNIKTAGAIIKETQNTVISDFEANLRSNRHRRMFRRVAKQTRGEDGNTMQGNAKVIRGITHISDKDDFFAGLVRVQKQVGKSGATVTLTERGLVEINGQLEVHPMEFSGINKVQRQVILDATKNIRTGTWTPEQFNQEMQNFCQEHNIVITSQRADTVASVRAMGSDRNSALCNMSEQQIDTLTLSILKFAKEHHRKILSIAVELCESLGFKKTAEIIRVVQFVANYVDQVAAAMENRYQEDLQAAQNSQGQDFNREQFDHEYGVQGKSMENFIRSVLENYNTYELIPVLKAAYQCMSPQAMGSNRNSVLHKMSEQQIYMLEFSMQKLAKEHHQKILSIAVELCESLGFKKTAEFLRVVQFVANYVEQVAAAMDNRYKEDLQAAQNSQGQDFNREQFDHEYGVQGKSMENFIRSVLENYNTYELIPVLKAAYQRMFPPKENPSDTEGNAEDGSVVTENNSHTSPDSNLDGEGEVVRTDASSATNVSSIDETTGADQEADVLYKKHRDFNKHGDLSDNEIYMIVQEVTGLCLYKGNSRLYRHGEATYVSVTDPHIVPLTVIISSNRHNHTVTASLIL